MKLPSRVPVPNLLSVGAPPLGGGVSVHPASVQRCNGLAKLARAAPKRRIRRSVSLAPGMQHRNTAQLLEGDGTEMEAARYGRGSLTPLRFSALAKARSSSWPFPYPNGGFKFDGCRCGMIRSSRSGWKPSSSAGSPSRPSRGGSHSP